MSTEQLIAQPQPTKKKNFHFFTACIGEDKLFTSLSALIVFVSYMSLFIAQVLIKPWFLPKSNSKLRLTGIRIKIVDNLTMALGI